MKWMLALCLCAGMGCQTAKPSSMNPLPKWEYKIINLVSGSQTGVYDRELAERRFNELGALGWEYLETQEYYAVFRRKK